MNDEDEEKKEDGFSFYEEVLEDPHYEYRFCSNDYHHDKTIQEHAWNYLVEKATEIVDLESLNDHEFMELRKLLEEFLGPTSNYINEVQVQYHRIKFFDINVCNNVTDTELEKIIAAYYYRAEIDDAHS